MNLKPDGHTIEVLFEAKWGVSSRMVCHREKADDTRPCWPYTEGGDPEPQEVGEKYGCVYTEWWDNGDGLENIGGPTVKVLFDLAAAEWDGDGFTFTLGRIKPEVEAS